MFDRPSAFSHDVLLSSRAAGCPRATRIRELVGLRIVFADAAMILRFAGADSRGSDSLAPGARYDRFGVDNGLSLITIAVVRGNHCSLELPSTEVGKERAFIDLSQLARN
jgi:hypothetical protein